MSAPERELRHLREVKEPGTYWTFTMGGWVAWRMFRDDAGARWYAPNVVGPVYDTATARDDTDFDGLFTIVGPRIEPPEWGG